MRHHRREDISPMFMVPPAHTPHAEHICRPELGSVNKEHHHSENTVYPLEEPESPTF